MVKPKSVTNAWGKVAVLMGGWSAEREISLASGKAVLAALRAQNIDAEGVDVKPNVIEQLRGYDYDKAFIALHGRGGEDGIIQALLELLGLPYTGSGVLASALCMNKVMTKRVWRGAGLPTPDFVVMERGYDAQAVVNQVGLPLMIKPAEEGSSLGMTKVETIEDFDDAWQCAAGYPGEVIAEHWINGKEYTVGILGAEALPVIRLDTPRTFFDFEAKYRATDTQYHCPCGLPSADESALQLLASEAFKVVGASGWGRVDLIVDAQGNPWLIEINTIPGMTDHSLVPMAAAAAGIDFKALVMRILEGIGG